MNFQIGETVVLLKEQGEVKAGTLGRIDRIVHGGLKNIPTLYSVLFGKKGNSHTHNQNLARVVNRRFPARNLSIGSRFVFDKCGVNFIHAGIVYTVKSKDDGFLSAYAHGGIIRNFRVIGDATVVLLDRVEERKDVTSASPDLKNDESEICNKLSFAICNEKTQPCGVLSFVTLHNKKTGAVRHQHGCSFCNLDSGDEFDFDEGSRIAIERAISGEKVKHVMLNCENYKKTVAMIYHFLRRGL